VEHMDNHEETSWLPKKTIEKFVIVWKQLKHNTFLFLSNLSNS